MQYRRRQAVIEAIRVPGDLAISIDGGPLVAVQKGHYLVFTGGKLSNVLAPEEFAKEYEETQPRIDPDWSRITWPKVERNEGAAWIEGRPARPPQPDTTIYTIRSTASDVRPEAYSMDGFPIFRDKDHPHYWIV